MRHALTSPLLLLCAGWAQAQTAPAPVTPAPAPVEKQTQHIVIEDAGSRIEELRVGGETQSISVQTKGGMPRYFIAPVSGQRTWKLLSF